MPLRVGERKSKGEAALNYVYSGYKRDSRRRSLVFSLSLNDFYEISQKLCYYCGEKPTKKQRKDLRCYGDFIYNGIDRFNNSIGYVKSNCVPCCFVCNRLKHNMEFGDFKDKIFQIHNHLLGNINA